MSAGLTATLILAVLPQEGALPNADTAQPPEAAAKPKVLEIHGHQRTDEYYWLNQREDPEVISYLEAENDYTKAMTGHTETLQKELFEEIKGRVKQTDESVPYQTMHDVMEALKLAAATSVAFNHDSRTSGGS